MISWVRRYPDGMLALVVAVAGLVPAVADWRHVALNLAISLAVAGSVAVRRRYPLTALACVQSTGVLVTAVHAMAASTAGFVLAYVVLLYTAGVMLRLAGALAGLGASLAAFWSEDAVLGHPAGEYVFSALLVTGPWLVGRYVARERVLRARLTTALDARRHALSVAAVADERRRIAREMHDLVAHALSAIAVQGNAASAALTVEPGRARAPVQAVNRLARQCVGDMRRLLTVLRDGSDPVPRARGDVADVRTATRGARLWPYRDWALAVLMAVAGVLAAARHGSALDGGLTVALAAAVSARRRWTLAALAAVVTLAVVLAAVRREAEAGGAFLVASLVLLFTAGALPSRRALGALSIGLAGYWAVDAMTASPPAGYLASAVIAGGAWLVGLVVGRERALRTEVITATEGERRALAAAAAANERRRIAREMHDVVAHGLSAIAVQSSAADAALDIDPARAAAPIHAITTLAEQCADEMRRLLTALGPDELPGTDLAAVLAAQTEMGLVVDTAIDTAALDGCSSAVRHAVTRITQEALTNVRRHSTVNTARVTIRGSAGELSVTVTDSGPARGPAEGPSGHGATGIRERVAVLGGRCIIGPDGAGWRVEAHLTLPATAGPLGLPA
ncbi:MAG TPA: histidine kinase [Trebonia sp.]